MLSCMRELRAQRRHHIECRVHTGEFLEDANHAPIVFERVQPRPGQHVAACGWITVLRLVHVP